MSTIKIDDRKPGNEEIYKCGSHSNKSDNKKLVK